MVYLGSISTEDGKSEVEIQKKNRDSKEFIH